MVLERDKIVVVVEFVDDEDMGCIVALDSVVRGMGRIGVWRALLLEDGEGIRRLLDVVGVVVVGGGVVVGIVVGVGEGVALVDEARLDWEVPVGEDLREFHSLPMKTSFVCGVFGYVCRVDADKKKKRKTRRKRWMKKQKFKIRWKKKKKRWVFSRVFFQVH